MTVPGTPVGATDDFARVEAFFAEQLKLPNPESLPPDSDPKMGKLSMSELAKVKDLCEDVAFLTRKDNAGWRARLARVLGGAFAGFERLIGGPPSPGPQSIAAAGHHAVPANADATPRECAKDFQLFDRLSQSQGGKFRGAVVVNCALGVVASVTVLLSLARISASESASDSHVPWATMIELACLLIISGIYIRGSTPEGTEQEKGGKSPSLRSHLGGQRWHQRWLEYRLLAERFRYVDLLLPLGTDVALNLAIAQTGNANRMWHERYFEWCVVSAAPSRQSVTQYRDHALAVIAEQEDYHIRNHARRGRIAHRLRWFADRLFVLAVGLCIIDILVALFGHEQSSSGHGSAWLLFGAAVLPIGSAAAYAILTHAEFAKAADASGEVFERIHHLYDKLRTTPDSDRQADHDSLKVMGSGVIEFVSAAITEATGWHAMLRDKNVPLA